MPGAFAEPPQPGRSRSGASDEHGQPAAEERIGDLSITRTVKDDGRALILYSHEEQEEG